MINHKTTNIPLRRAELITPFGVGAISTNNEGVNLMTGALDQWFTGKNVDKSEFIIKEPRLSKVLGVKEFRLPPDYRTSLGNTEKEILK